MLDDTLRFLAGVAPIRPNPTRVSRSYAEIVAGLLRPERSARLARVDALIRARGGVRRAADLWLALDAEGLLPSTWTDGTLRFAPDPFRFSLAGRASTSRRFWLPSAIEPSEAPSTPAATRALAASSGDIAEIEALWGEAITRLRSWGMRSLQTEEHVFWGTTRRSRAPRIDDPSIRRLLLGISRPSYSVATAVHAFVEPVPEILPPEGGPYFYEASWEALYGDVFWGDYRWRCACRLGLRVATPPPGFDPGPIPPDILARTYAELPNPFEPLLEILARGYAWGLRRVQNPRFGYADKTHVVLVAPEIEPSSMPPGG